MKLKVTEINVEQLFSSLEVERICERIAQQGSVEHDAVVSEVMTELAVYFPGLRMLEEA